MKAVAFLDLLGFSNAVSSSTSEALTMLQSYNTIIEEKLFERKIHPSYEYLPQIQELAKRTSVESFDTILPFSDSLFITSENCSDFVLQLGDFLLKTFLLTSHIYNESEDKQDPMLYEILNIKSTSDGEPTVEKKQSRVPPALFRGGISYGEIQEITPSALLNGNKLDYHSIMGEAVIKAVRMEKMVKGPRIVVDNSVYEQLNDKAKLYCRELPEDSSYYEILWPAMGFILENKHMLDQEFSNFYDIFNPVYKLWRFYEKNETVSVQYERFIELIVSSTLKIYQYAGMLDFSNKTISGIIKAKFSKAEITRIFGYLNIFWFI